MVAFEGCRRMFAFPIEALQRGIGAFHQSNHDFAIARVVGFLHQDIISIHNVLVLHALAFDLEDKHILGAGNVTERDGFGFSTASIGWPAAMRPIKAAQAPAVAA